MTKQHLDYLVTAYIRGAITEQAFGEINALLTPGKLLADALEEAWGHCSDLCLELPYDIWRGSPFREHLRTRPEGEVRTKQVGGDHAG